MRGHPDHLLGRYLLKVRTDLGYSRRHVAEAIGRDRKYLSRVELNGQTLSPYYVPSLARALNIPVENFFSPPIPSNFDAHYKDEP